MDFSYWRNDHQEESKRFNCDYCIQKGYCNKRLVCFLKKKKKTVSIPLLPDNFHKRIDTSQSDIYRKFDRIQKEVTKEEVIQYYSHVKSLFPNERAFKVWAMPLMRLGLKNQLICPIPFFDKYLDDIVSWESAADKYGVLPYKGSYLDQPLYVIEGFNICRSAESRYTNTKMKDSKKKSKKTGANSPAGKRRNMNRRR